MLKTPYDYLRSNDGKPGESQVLLRGCRSTIR